MIEIKAGTPRILGENIGDAISAAQMGVLVARQALGRAILQARYEGGSEAAISRARSQLVDATTALTDWEALATAVTTFTLDVEDAGRVASAGLNRGVRARATAEFKKALKAFEADRTLARNRTSLKQAADELFRLAKSAGRVEEFRKVLRSGSRYAEIVARY